MKEIRIHGRGGQGAVVGSEILAEAAMIEGKFAQSFPRFGAERRGAPLMAFTRIDEKPIRLRSQIYEPDYVIVLDSSICTLQDVTDGLKPEGAVVLNSPLAPEEIRNENLVAKGKVYSIDATSLAMRFLGRPILNTVMLGVFAAATKEIQIESLFETVKRRFPNNIAEKNITAMNAAYKAVKTSGGSQ